MASHISPSPTHAAARREPLHGSPLAGFAFTLEFLYGGSLLGGDAQLVITAENVFHALSAAHYLGVARLEQLCVQYLAQHLAPQNLTSCLSWATRTDHGEASELLVRACETLLALRLPSELAAWSSALPHLQPEVLLRVLSSDELAVPSEYERYQLVKRVAMLFGDSGAAGSTADGGDDDGQREASSETRPAHLAVSHMLGQALNISGGCAPGAAASMASCLQLLRSSPAGPECAQAAGGGSHPAGSLDSGRVACMRGSAMAAEGATATARHPGSEAGSARQRPAAHLGPGRHCADVVEHGGRLPQRALLHLPGGTGGACNSAPSRRCSAAHTKQPPDRQVCVRAMYRQVCVRAMYRQCPRPLYLYLPTYL